MIKSLPTALPELRNAAVLCVQTAPAVPEDVKNARSGLDIPLLVQPPQRHVIGTANDYREMVDAAAFGRGE